ncbi:MAG: hypothetical protein IPK82_13435 [Polyangiaceae bacterium]|nr:hypothetical protein [Polyangiaceae bacterium]
MLLPTSFPPFVVTSEDSPITIVTAVQLTSDQEQQVTDACAILGDYPGPQFRTPKAESPAFDVSKGARSGGAHDLCLIPSRQFAKHCNRDLRLLHEEDEDFWMSHRQRVFAEALTDASSILDHNWRSDRELGCIVDASVIPPHNLRTYLSLYDRVYLVAPLDLAFSGTCEAMGVSQEEFLELLGLGRLRVLLPQSLDRYDRTWLNRAAEAAPNALLMSRRLAAATIVDARQRVPLLFPPLGSAERHILLHVLATQLPQVVEGIDAQKFNKFVTELASNWANFESFISDRGAMGTMHLGIGFLAGELYEYFTGRDMRFELWTAAPKIEWAGALNAHAFPTAIDGHDETAACDMIAGLYTPHKKRSTTVAPPAALTAIENILSIDNKVPIVPFAKEFWSKDIVRLRHLVLQIASQNVDEDHLRVAIKKFNAEVRHYERRPDLVKPLNLVGLISATMAATGAIDDSIRHLVPVMGILLGFLVSRIVDEIPARSTNAGKLFDLMNSLLTMRANPNAVLVARAKKHLKVLKG